MRVVLHLLAFLLPAGTLLFLVTGPHGVGMSLVGLAVIAGLLAADTLGPPEVRDPDGSLPPAFFDGILAVLTVLHLAVIAALPVYVAATGPTFPALVATFLVGNTSAQGIVLAHELVHRRSPWFRQSGRLLLSGVLYEHFTTEHLRGHHKRVATPDDPATARYGERFWPFFVRTVPAQLRSAWDLECRRIGATRWTDHRHNRVLHGLVVGWGAAGLVGVALGPWALLAHLGQAAFAVVMLEGVNFVEHWGLQRAGKRVQPEDSWDSAGGLTYYMLIGLARHGDHHAHAARPWQDLRLFAETPRMPWGYMATTYAAVFAGSLLLPRLDAELRAKGLGPYRLERQAA
ncbi:MAG: fatty acid desaturase [Myxococcales bacterium]|nr:fatty acid desaturase [Myxococcales bacterium]